MKELLEIRYVECKLLYFRRVIHIYEINLTSDTRSFVSNDTIEIT